MEMSDIRISELVFDAAHVIFGTRPILVVDPFANEPEQTPGLVKFTDTFQDGRVIVDREGTRAGALRLEISNVLKSFIDAMQKA